MSSTITSCPSCARCSGRALDGKKALRGVPSPSLTWPPSSRVAAASPRASCDAVGRFGGRCCSSRWSSTPKSGCCWAAPPNLNPPTPPDRDFGRFAAIHPGSTRRTGRRLAAAGRPATGRQGDRAASGTRPRPSRMMGTFGGVHHLTAISDTVYRRHGACSGPTRMDYPGNYR